MRANPHSPVDVDLIAAQPVVGDRVTMVKYRDRAGRLVETRWFDQATGEPVQRSIAYGM
ncbi:hypothetical protein GFY24_38880 [Nocardia sp. SYP-A9097]|uniref:hypothetical protein n=1 Tax=Nocardia sp. SYP-A9097 TaxID=2663237 RepID=UPI00129A52AA|nr:hypothetical protein [Nocardia sp. SYP-A9097]MRH93315.1 hypothetical protein [Nocardia sp. SYP-A9097]